MGRRDYRRRETKKPKKGTKKPLGAGVLQMPETVEVVKRGKKEKQEE